MRAVKCLLVFLFVLSAVPRAFCGGVEDNVVISQSTDSYVFVEKDGRIEIKATMQTEYEATRYSAVVVPHVYYNDDITLDKASGGKAQYKNVNSPNVFHDGSKICFFGLQLGAKGAKAKAEFKLTYKNAALFAKILLAEPYPIKKKEVRFTIPASLSEIRLVDMNFSSRQIVRNDDERSDGTRVVTYTISDLAPINSDPFTLPTLATEPYILVQGYFRDLDDLSRFQIANLDVDTTIPDIERIVSEIIGESTDRREIIDKIYRFVQQKVRYVAYEEGEAAFRPDAPANVLAKNYGDCKGMSLLLATLLSQAGVEAYVADIGTSKIPFRISDYPTVAAANHVICIAPAPADTLYLDATYEYIPFSHIPNSIQGKDAMMFKSGGYEMIDIPRLPAEANSETALFRYEIVDGKLMGVGEVTMTGDVNEYAQSGINDVDLTNRAEAMARWILPRGKMTADNQSIATETAGGQFRISGRVTDSNGIVDTGDAIYVDLSFGAESLIKRVDLDSRRGAYKIPFPMKIVRKASIAVPEDYCVGDLPEDYSATCDGVEFSCRFESADDKVSMIKEVVVRNPVIELADLGKWNTALSNWHKASAHQVEFRKVSK